MTNTSQDWGSRPISGTARRPVKSRQAARPRHDRRAPREPGRHAQLVPPGSQTTTPPLKGRRPDNRSFRPSRASPTQAVPRPIQPARPTRSRRLCDADRVALGGARRPDHRGAGCAVAGRRAGGLCRHRAGSAHARRVTGARQPLRLDADIRPVTGTVLNEVGDPTSAGARRCRWTGFRPTCGRHDRHRGPELPEAPRRGSGRAAARHYYAVKERSLSGPGGSTITQQFVKLTFLSSENTITRKVKEAILAAELTRSLPQGHHPADLSERDLLRQPGVRHRGCGGDLLRRAGAGSDAGAGCAVGRATPGAGILRPLH